MRTFGYQKDRDELIELREVSIISTIAELENIIQFLQETKELHSKFLLENESCHSHYRDWDTAWKNDFGDIIVVTTSK